MCLGNSRGAKTITHEYKISKQYITVQISLQIERLKNNRFVTAALKAITAAVVGVVLYVAVWFGLHVCFENIHEFRFDYIRLLVPDWPTFEPGVLLITLAALIATLKYKADMFMVIGASAVLGILYFYMII